MFKGPTFHATTPKFTRLHQAAADGNVKSIQAILSKSPDSVYAVDESGLTPLHHAALNGHLNAVKALTPNGEGIFTLDNLGFLPITYVDSEKHPEIIEYFTEMNSYPSLTTNIHFAAANGDIEELKRLLDDAPENLEKTNIEGFTPLMYAIISNQRKAAELLVRYGADVDVLDVKQCDLVSLANELPILNYTKRICGLKSIFINRLRQQFKALIENELITAKEQNKHLLIILGETHHLYKILQLEEIMYKVAKELGIDTLLVEARQEVTECYPTDETAVKLGMSVTAIDHPSLEATMEQRNAHMTQAMFDTNQNAVIRIGSDHLQGFLEIPGDVNLASKFHQRFHIVPFNLSTISKSFTPITTEAIFASNEQHTILVTPQGLSQADDALRRWNPQQQTATPLHSAFKSSKRKLPSTDAKVATPKQNPKRAAEEIVADSKPKRLRKK